MKIEDVLTEGWQDGMKHLGNAWKALTGGNDDSEAEIDRLTQASGRAFQDQWVRMVANLRHTYKDKEDQGLGEAAKQLAAMFMKIGVPMLAPGATGINDLMVKRAWTGQDYATGQPKSTPAIYAGNKTVKQLFDTIIAETKAGRERGSAVAQAFDLAADQALAELQRKQNDPYGSQADNQQDGQAKQKNQADQETDSLTNYFGKTLANTPFRDRVTPGSPGYENAVIPIEYIDFDARKPDGETVARSFVHYNGEWYEEYASTADDISLDENTVDPMLARLLEMLISGVSRSTGGKTIRGLPDPLTYAYGSRQSFMRRVGTSPVKYKLMQMTDAQREMYK
jgi:hypothetical protein